MFNVSALLLDDALKPATPLINGAISEMLGQFSRTHWRSPASAGCLSWIVDVDRPSVEGHPKRLLDNSRIANSRTGRLADWSTRGLDNSRTGQVADWTTRGCHRRLWVLSFRSFGGMRDRELSSPRLVQSASWPVREMSSPRVGNPRVGVSASCPVTCVCNRPIFVVFIA